MNKKSIMCIMGTRPEAIKMAPVVQELKRRPDFNTVLLNTAQHREMLDQVMQVFDLKPNLDLDLMQPGQTLSDLTARVITAMTDKLISVQPDLVLAQGDTTTVYATALCCFYLGIPFGHIEAGLRSGDMQHPYPEEFNRRSTALITRYHFAPTRGAADNLLREGIALDHIHITGNTVIDALKQVQTLPTFPVTNLPVSKPYILLTCHRRESFGSPLNNILSAVRTYAEEHPDIAIWYPVHPNPKVQRPAYEALNGVDNILLTDPIDYVTFSKAIHNAHIIMSDSGGIQEEATYLGKPTLILRSVTERPEAVQSGPCVLVGTSPDAIISHLNKLSDNSEMYEACARPSNVFGTGEAAAKIVDILHEKMNKDELSR